MSVFEFIEAHRGEFYLQVMCRMLGVTKVGYFSWRGSAQGCKPLCGLLWARRPISKRETWDEQLDIEIQEIHEQSKGRYGVPRVHAELGARGKRSSKRRVARLMNALGLRGKSRKQYKVTTKAAPGRQPAPDLVARNFQIENPNKVWAGGSAYLTTK